MTSRSEARTRTIDILTDFHVFRTVMDFFSEYADVVNMSAPMNKEKYCEFISSGTLTINEAVACATLSVMPRLSNRQEQTKVLAAGVKLMDLIGDGRINPSFLPLFKAEPTTHRLVFIACLSAIPSLSQVCRPIVQEHLDDVPVRVPERKEGVSIGVVFEG